MVSPQTGQALVSPSIVDLPEPHRAGLETYPQAKFCRSYGAGPVTFYVPTADAVGFILKLLCGFNGLPSTPKPSWLKAER
jgi:hypothetical protein